MTMIVVIFNLKEGVSPQAYEDWARASDLPAVNQLGSVAKFEVLRTTGVLGSDDAAPYQYVELLNVADMDALGGDVSSETMQRVAAEFQQFADNPTFMLTQDIQG
jgi:REDY-like protein HapK